MIDNYTQAMALIEKMKAHLPITARAGPAKPTRFTVKPSKKRKKSKKRKER